MFSIIYGSPNSNIRKFIDYIERGNTTLLIKETPARQVYEIVRASDIDEKWGNPYLGWGHSTWTRPECNHDFVNTGTLRSYCRHCNADAEWCSQELKFKLRSK